jgi:hypothetical protein
MVDIAGLNQDPFLWWPRKSFQKSGPAVFWPQLRWLYTYSCSKLLGLWSFSARLLLWSPWRGHFLLDVVLHHDEPFRFYLFLPFYTQYYISYCWNNIVINVWNIWLVVVWNMIFLNDFPYNGNNNLNWRTHIFSDVVILLTKYGKCDDWLMRYGRYGYVWKWCIPPTCWIRENDFLIYWNWEVTMGNKFSDKPPWYHQSLGFGL